MFDLGPWLGHGAGLPLPGRPLASSSFGILPGESSFSWAAKGGPHAMHLREPRPPSGPGRLPVVMSLTFFFFFF